MPEAVQVEKARQFAQLHEQGMLILPNAWDPGSAVIIASAGAPAIATTSGGVAWSTGRPDGQALSREQMIERVTSIARAVDLPVTADVEGGYGPDPEDVAATVEAAVAAGVVGVNIEDSRAAGGSLFSAAEQAARLKAGSEAAAAAGLPGLVINARTDVFLHGIGKEEGRLAEVTRRAEAYAEAGATSLFVPGLLDLDILEELVRSTPLPINAMAGPGAPSIADLERVGVRRVSLGTAAAQAAYGITRRVAAEALEKGTFEALAGVPAYVDVNSSFPR
jgi:2-methylisocitrate lyase-like PEP mutase family enzyme